MTTLKHNRQMMTKMKGFEAMWVMRAGKNGEAHDLFLDHGLIALRDARLGNLLNLSPTRNAFYAAYRAKHPNDTRTGSAGIAGKFFRFVHEVQIGDFVQYPSLKNKDKLIYIGRVANNYKFNLKGNREFPHQRLVDWQYCFPKNLLSEFAKRELGAARTFYKFKTHHKEIRRLIADKKVRIFAAQI